MENNNQIAFKRQNVIPGLSFLAFGLIALWISAELYMTDTPKYSPNWNLATILGWAGTASVACGVGIIFRDVENATFAEKDIFWKFSMFGYLSCLGMFFSILMTV